MESVGEFSVLEVTHADANELQKHVLPNLNKITPCVIQRLPLGKSFVKVFHEHKEIRQKSVDQILTFLKKPVDKQQPANSTASSASRASTSQPSSSNYSTLVKEPAELQTTPAVKPKPAKHYPSGSTISQTTASKSKTFAKPAIEPNVEAAVPSPPKTPEFRIHIHDPNESDLDGPAVLTYASWDDPPKDETQVVAVNLRCEGASSNLWKLFLKHPATTHFLQNETVIKATPLQLRVWPSLLNSNSMLLMGPEKSGKMIAYFAIAFSFCLHRVVVIVTQDRRRAIELTDIGNYNRVGIEAYRPPIKIRNSRKFIAICTPDWFLNNRTSLDPSMVVFDRFDSMVLNGFAPSCIKLARTLQVPIVATARTGSEQLRQALKNMRIRSIAAVPCPIMKNEYEEVICPIEDSPDARKTKLIEIIRALGRESITLIYAELRKEVPMFLRLLDTHFPDSVIDLEAVCQIERELFQTHLQKGQKGLYIVTLKSNSWIGSVRNADAVINLRPPDRLKNYIFRRGLLRPKGRIYTLIKPNDWDYLQRDLLYLLTSKLDESMSSIRDMIKKRQDNRKECEHVLLSE